MRLLSVLTVEKNGIRFELFRLIQDYRILVQEYEHFRYEAFQLVKEL